MQRLAEAREIKPLTVHLRLSREGKWVTRLDCLEFKSTHQLDKKWLKTTQCVHRVCYSIGKWSCISTLTVKTENKILLWSYVIRDVYPISFSPVLILLILWKTGNSWDQIPQGKHKVNSKSYVNGEHHGGCAVMKSTWQEWCHWRPYTMTPMQS